MRERSDNRPGRRRLSTEEVRLLVEAQLALVVCQVMRWRRPLGRLVTPVEAGAAAGSTSDRGTMRAAAAVAWAVTRAARYGVFRPKCLVRSLAIQRMLRRRGIEGSSVNIGVRMERSMFQAHAWVELGGAVVGDSVELVRRFAKVADFDVVQI